MYVPVIRSESQLEDLAFHPNVFLQVISMLDDLLEI